MLCPMWELGAQVALVVIHAVLDLKDPVIVGQEPGHQAGTGR